MNEFPIFDVRDLSVVLGRRRIVGNLSLQVRTGELIGLIGPNGAGKSTLLRSLCGLVRSEGTITILGRDASTMASSERARFVAYVPQEHEIAWPLTVERLVALGRVPHSSSISFQPSAADSKAVRSAMERMDITRFEGRAADALSGGERVRVLIARALAQDTPVLIADEPAAGLDPAHQINLMKTFRALANEGRTVIASMHDLGLAARWCSRLVLLNDGAIAADGIPAEVLDHNNLARVYGVSAHIGAAAGGPLVQVLETIDKGERGL